MANKNDNLIPEAHKLTLEDQSNGGKRSGEVRREKATMKKTLEMLLDEKNKKGVSYRNLTTLGLIKGAIDGKAENYKVMLQVLGELQEEENTETPNVTINIVDNSNLEGVMYDENK